MPTKEELEKLYLVDKLSSRKIADLLGTYQKQVMRWLEDYSIPRRSYKENIMPVKKGVGHTWGKKIAKSMKGNHNSKLGSNHWNWKGEEVGYIGIHHWVKKLLGRPKYCEHCKMSYKKRYEWANISGEYKRDPLDWKRLCTSCHKIYDNSRKS